MATKKTIVSGIQPTGNLHVGNYLGAVKNWVALQDSGKYDCFFFIADYHSLTGTMSAGERRDQIIRTAAELLAVGIDPEKSTLFVQSHVPEHTELAWVFSCTTPVAELERMTQFKDKSARQKARINMGLLTYPILQAADILLYHGTHVPVGEDQVQHLELTRDIARWFNNTYKTYFPETKPLLTKTPRVKSLLDPEKKMSKSLGAGHVIELADEPDVIEKKVKKAVTATTGGGMTPGVENLLVLLQAFGESAIYKEFAAQEKNGTIQYGMLKEAVAGSIAAYVANFRERREEYLGDHDAIADLLFRGTEKASAIAKETMEQVRKMVGIR